MLVGLELAGLLSVKASHPSRKNCAAGDSPELTICCKEVESLYGPVQVETLSALLDAEHLNLYTNLSPTC